MRISQTLCLYIGRQYLFAFLGVFAAFLLIILLADTVELLRRIAGKPHVSFSDAIEMALLKLPFMGQRAFPFAALLAGMFVFWRMSRARELDVVRAAGISAWQFLLPAVVVALLCGLFHMTVFNPVASSFLARYERIAAILLERKVNTLALRQTVVGGCIEAAAQQQAADFQRSRDIVVKAQDGHSGLPVKSVTGSPSHRCSRCGSPSSIR